MADQLHPMTPHHLPFYVVKPGETDVLMIGMGIFLLFAVLGFGILYLKIHSLPERMAHKTHKLQFEIVAVLGLISLFTHMHIFWIVGLLLALIDLPDFGTPLNRIAGSMEKIAQDSGADIAIDDADPPEPASASGHTAPSPKPATAPSKEVGSHA